MVCDQLSNGIPVEDSPGGRWSEALKYPSLLGSYRLVSGINNESSKLVYHNKLQIMII